MVHRKTSGFTLLELSIVLIVIGLVVAAGMSGGSQMIAAARRAQTQKKLDRIEEALMAFRTQYNRLPCPADLTLPAGNANYGVEAASGGTCLGGTPTANSFATAYPLSTLVAEGGVPIQTLNLPDDFALDGWGHKFVYAVDTDATITERFKVYPINETCGSLITGTAIKSQNGAIYTVLSPGPDGHGGYFADGTRYSNGSDNAWELANCHCNSSAVNQPYAMTYYAGDATDDPTDINDSFDDIVRFKERWQLQARDDNTLPNYYGPELVLGLASGSGVPSTVTVFSRNLTGHCDYFVKQADVTPDPSQIQNIDISSDNHYLATTSVQSPFVYLYKNNGTSFTNLPNPPILPATQTLDVAFSHSFAYLALTMPSAATPVIVYKFNENTDSFTKLADPPSSGTAAAMGVAFSPDDRYLVIGSGGSPWLLIYRTVPSTNTFVLLPSPATPPTSQPQGMAFSPDGRYLAAVTANPPYLIFYKIDESTNTFTKLPDPAWTPPNALASWKPAFSPDGRYVAFSGGNFSPYLLVYRINTATDTFTKIADPAVNPGSQSFGLAFNADGRYLAIGTSITPYVVFYKMNSQTDTLSRLADPASPPGSPVTGVAFRH